MDSQITVRRFVNDGDNKEMMAQFSVRIVPWKIPYSLIVDFMELIV